MSEPDRMIDLAAVQAFLRQFAADREWEQFHTPKNLAMALAGEAGELLEIFQWLTPEESGAITSDEATRDAVAAELADILQYVIRLADVAGIDLNGALWDKLHANASRYPIEKARGNATKYTEWSGNDA